ncbi:MAG: hypothetical protein EPN30_10895 [Actinomycetota bacterium]|nr:MAG: hypothetical protein EPN30_10895 [Actinomycetota bacterium]
MREVRFVDTTLRDGHASLWAEAMRTGMMLAVAKEMDRAGFVAAEVIATSHFKKCVRELREDPWERIRVMSKAMPNTPLASMGDSLATFGNAPLPIIKLYMERLAANGIRRSQLMNASNDMSGRIVQSVRSAQEAGLEVVVALVYSQSPKHTDEYYIQKAKEAVSIGSDIVYLKDPGGLMTPERAETLVPAIMQAVDGVPLEFHTHCTTGLGPMSVIAAVKAGIDTVHTAVPPLANGASQPSVFNIAGNLRALGYAMSIDEEPLAQASEKLAVIAHDDGLPAGRPLEYDYSQYLHQVPGGVISNLRHQLAQMGMVNKLGEVLEESIRVRAELGYPIMVTPFSQFVVSQAAINILSRERYGVVTDEIIKYTLGEFGVEASSGVTSEARSRILDRPRAKMLAQIEPDQPSLEEIRNSLGGPGISDDELLLRYAAGGEAEVHAMRDAGPYRDYSNRTRPIVGLVEAVTARKNISHISVHKPDLSLVIDKKLT